LDTAVLAELALQCNIARVTLRAIVTIKFPQ